METKKKKKLEKEFTSRRINIKTSQNLLSIENTGSSVKIITCNASLHEDQIENAEKFTFEGDFCLISIGRKKRIY
jgi:hypothetical protein